MDDGVRWLDATVVEVRQASPTARTIVLTVPSWPGHAAGQHVDVRLTAMDGYATTRPYAITSTPAGPRVELTVEPVPGGEVSNHLVHVLSVGDALDLRGPLGGWFVWRSEQTEPVNLVAGGTGLAPLMAMVRAVGSMVGGPPLALLCSVRRPEQLLFTTELARRARRGQVRLTCLWTQGEYLTGARRRVDRELLAAATWPAADAPTTYVSGPSGFVDLVVQLLHDAGHQPDRVRAERLGPGSPV